MSFKLLLWTRRAKKAGLNFPSLIRKKDEDSRETSGSFPGELKVENADDRKLIMDIIKYGTVCKAVEPKALQDCVAGEIRRWLEVL